MWSSTHFRRTTGFSTTNNGYSEKIKRTTRPRPYKIVLIVNKIIHMGLNNLK